MRLRVEVWKKWPGWAYPCNEIFRISHLIFWAYLINARFSALQTLVLLAVKGRLWQGVQNMCTAVYCLPLATWSGCKVQEDRDLPDMLQAEKCLPGLPAGSWIRSTSSSQGYSARYQFEWCNSKEWCQSRVFCRRAWSKGMFYFFIIENWCCLLIFIILMIHFLYFLGYFEVH